MWFLTQICADFGVLGVYLGNDIGLISALALF